MDRGPINQQKQWKYFYPQLLLNLPPWQIYGGPGIGIKICFIIKIYTCNIKFMLHVKENNKYT